MWRLSKTEMYQIPPGRPNATRTMGWMWSRTSNRYVPTGRSNKGRQRAERRVRYIGIRHTDSAASHSTGRSRQYQWVSFHFILHIYAIETIGSLPRAEDSVSQRTPVTVADRCVSALQLLILGAIPVRDLSGVSSNCYEAISVTDESTRVVQPPSISIFKSAHCTRRAGCLSDCKTPARFRPI